MDFSTVTRDPNFPTYVDAGVNLLPYFLLTSVALFGAIKSAYRRFRRWLDKRRKVRPTNWRFQTDEATE